MITILANSLAFLLYNKHFYGVISDGPAFDSSYGHESPFSRSIEASFALKGSSFSDTNTPLKHTILLKIQNST